MATIEPAVSGQEASHCDACKCSFSTFRRRGLREAVKNENIAAARKLLSQGVDANYRDKQGSSLMHLVKHL